VSHVVIQAAEFPTADLAVRCEEELRRLVAEYVAFEKTDPDPWSQKRVPPPLVSFGERHGVVWPHDEASRFLIKGLFEDEVQILRLDRMVFLWAGGFDLGGDTMRKILGRLGATAAVGEGKCHLTIQHADPTARVEELAEFLREEDYEDQFSVVNGGSARSGAYFSITVVGPNGRMRLEFDDSGVQDWAFTAVLPQLNDEAPALWKS
jgi:hypothetical protein